MKVNVGYSEVKKLQVENFNLFEILKCCQHNEIIHKKFYVSF